MRPIPFTSWCTLNKFLVIVGSALFGITAYALLWSPTSAATQTCHMYQNGDSFPSQYGAPYSFFGTKPMHITGICTDSNIRVSVGTENKNAYTYNDTYFYTDNRWQKVPIRGSRNFENDTRWISGISTVDIAYPNEKKDTVWFVAYVCEQISGEWRCGCSNQSCSKGMWQIQGFNRKNTLQVSTEDARQESASQKTSNPKTTTTKKSSGSSSGHSSTNSNTQSSNRQNRSSNTTQSTQTQDAKSQYVPAGYSLVWSDEMTQLSLDPGATGAGNWGTYFISWNTRRLYDNSDDGIKMHDGWKGFGANAGPKSIAQVLTEAGWNSPSLHHVKNGALTMRAYPIPAAYHQQFDWYGQNPQSHSAASMITSELSHSQKYGYWEARVRIDSISPSQHFALWLLPSDNSWPPEIDMLEAIIDKNNTQAGILMSANAHGVPQGTPGNQGMVFGITPGEPVGRWYTYGFEWTSDTLTWTVDGKVVKTLPNYINKPMYILASWEIGGNWGGEVQPGTTWPAEASIDYIRVYQSQ